MTERANGPSGPDGCLEPRKSVRVARGDDPEFRINEGESRRIIGTFGIVGNDIRRYPLAQEILAGLRTTEPLTMLPHETVEIVCYPADGQDAVDLRGLVSNRGVVVEIDSRLVNRPGFEEPDPAG